MKTQQLTSSPEDIRAAGEILRQGGLVAIPTETVYGLAANALDGRAVSAIFAAKGRPQDNPLIVHISRLEQLEGIVSEIPEDAMALAAQYWPGPLTIVMPKGKAIPDEVSCGLDTVGVRMPSHEVARAIIDAAGVPLAAPSANLSGSPSPTTAAHVTKDMGGRIDAVLDGGECAVGLESTVVSVCGEVPQLLRPGAVTPEMIEEATGRVSINSAVLNDLAEGEQAASPGMKYKHYAPSSRVVILRGSREAYIDYCNSRGEEKACALCFEGDGEKLAIPFIEYGREDDLFSQARGLFAALRALDDTGAQVAYARCCAPEGVGLAVYNRLLRSAGFDVRDI